MYNNKGKSGGPNGKDRVHQHGDYAELDRCSIRLEKREFGVYLEEISAYDN